MEAIEASFTFKMKKQLVPFFGRVSNRRLKGIFWFKDKRLIDVMKLVMGEGINYVSHYYKMNMDVYSLMATWSLEFENSVDTVKIVMKALVPKEYLLGMDSIFEWVVLGEGFYLAKGINGDVPVDNLPFVQWQEGDLKKRFRALSRCGWKAMKTLVEMMWVEGKMRDAMEKDRWEVGPKLRPRKRKINADGSHPRLCGGST